MSTPAIEVHDVSKRFRLYKDRNQSLKATVLRGGRAKYDEFWALKDVSFDIPEGSTFGLIGENGSGKSTLLKCVAGILTPDRGTITRNGRLAALLELGSGFHPELSGRENVYLNGSILGLTRKEIDAAFDSIVDFSGIEKFIDQPVKNYSSGMYVRLGFSIAIHIEPDILLVDEILAVGDAAFQRKCMEKFRSFRESGRTVVIVSHAMGTMRDMCDYAVWLREGEVVEWGPTASVVDDYVEDTTMERIAQPLSPVDGEQFGDGAAVVTALEILDGDNQPASKFRTGDTVTMRLRYDATELIEKPVFGLAIYSLEGVKIWSHNTRDDDLVFDNISGTGAVELTIDRLPLNPGLFDISVSITDWTRLHNHHHVKNIKRFDVSPGGIVEGEGIITIGAHYRVSG